MKRKSIYNILPMLLAFLLWTGTTFSSTTNNTRKAIAAACYNNNHNSVDPEIEIFSYCSSHIATSFHVVQKTPANCNLFGSSIVRSVHSDVLNYTGHVELFDNTHVRHNYPSHNFW